MSTLRFSVNSNSLPFFFFLIVCHIYLCLLNNNYRHVKLQCTSFHFLTLELFKKKLFNETLIEKDIQAVDLLNLDLG